MRRREGFRKAEGLPLAFHIDLANIPMGIGCWVELPPKSKQRHAEPMRSGPSGAKHSNRTREAWKEVYNEAWQDNWGFVPMTDAEVDFMAERLESRWRWKA